MSAEENLNPAQFYHGTDAELAPGHVISPSSIPESQGGKSSVDQNYSYASRDPHRALDFAYITRDVRRAYQVEPVDSRDVEPDPKGPRLDVRSKAGFRVLGKAEGSK